MARNTSNLSTASKELIADLLKERIYATFALLAVLISIDPNHSTPLKSEFIVIGTVVSLWAASLVAAQMARRVVFQGEDKQGREHEFRRHSQMLAALVFPVFTLLLAFFKVISLNVAINVSIASALILLASWSFLSARSLKTTGVPLVILIALELGIGAAVVGLKIYIGH